MSLDIRADLPLSVDKISEQVDWYSMLEPNFQEVDQLINCRRLMSTFMCGMAKGLGELEKKALHAEGKRKTEHARIQMENLSKGSGKAKIIADDRCSIYVEIELEIKGEVKEAVRNYNAFRSVLGCLNQHISSLEYSDKVEL